MRGKQLTVTRLSAVAVGVLIVLTTGCENSNTVAGPPIQPPNGSVAGAWTGTFDSANPDCDKGTPAQASFEQTGSTVSGSLKATENGCGFTNVAFRGTLQGNTLGGTISGDHQFSSGGVLNGTLSGGTLEIALKTPSGFFSGGQMHLRR